MSFNTIVNNIKKINIQGAENIAKAALNAIYEKYIELEKKKQLRSLKKYMQILQKTRSTEPCMFNTLNYFYKNINQKSVQEVIKDINNHFDKTQLLISKYGAQKINNNTIIFTHCHSQTVTKTIIHAKGLGKKIIVHNTETRPLFQGRITATELARKGIKVVHFVDSAMRIAIKNSDLVLIGADAITTEGYVYNKIGSELVCEEAKDYNIPVYVCTDSWKFDPKTTFGFEEEIEKRHMKEVWPNPPKHVVISNYAFEKISPELITGLITELGIIKPEILLEEVKKAYPWMFS